MKLTPYLEVNTYLLGGEKMFCVSGVLVLLVAKSVLTNRRLVLGIMAGSIDCQLQLDDGGENM